MAQSCRECSEPLSIPYARLTNIPSLSHDRRLPRASKTSVVPRRRRIIIIPSLSRRRGQVLVRWRRCPLVSISPILTLFHASTADPRRITELLLAKKSELRLPVSTEAVQLLLASVPEVIEVADIHAGDEKGYFSVAFEVDWTANVVELARIESL